MTNPTELTFPMGTVVGFHGLHGVIKVRPSTNNPELLLDVKNLRVQMPNREETLLTVTSIELDKKLLFIKVKNHPDRTAVEYLLNANLFTAEAELLPLEEEEFWVKDLVGMDVFTTTGSFIGTVSSIIYGGNDLIEIKPENGQLDKTILVPFVKNLVPTVDIKKNRIEVLDIPGLLEPQ